ncbi:hypothetical protein [Streptomyces sp. NBC_01465]|uniref:hypothetical protein n=1 Tax=Streptomyces sp. NBC_01465 TaxID=2903878 RepID=UPI002E2F879F|nr:hypothetical protein [Streptomyces sp. NBC_01465]
MSDVRAVVMRRAAAVVLLLALCALLVSVCCHDGGNHGPVRVTASAAADGHHCAGDAGGGDEHLAARPAGGAHVCELPLWGGVLEPRYARGVECVREQRAGPPGARRLLIALGVDRS